MVHRSLNIITRAIILIYLVVIWLNKLKYPLLFFLFILNLYFAILEKLFSGNELPTLRSYILDISLCVLGSMIFIGITEKILWVTWFIRFRIRYLRNLSFDRLYRSLVLVSILVIRVVPFHFAVTHSAPSQRGRFEKALDHFFWNLASLSMH